MADNPVLFLEQTVASEDETAAIARDLAGRMTSPEVILLRGDLGMGKTAFARAFLRALPGVAATEAVPSPTYNLLLTYDTDLGPVWHFDLYRVEDPRELEELGWYDALTEGLCLVEWPDHAGSALPKDFIAVDLKPGETETARRITITAMGITCLNNSEAAP